MIYIRISCSSTVISNSIIKQHYISQPPILHITLARALASMHHKAIDDKLSLKTRSKAIKISVVVFWQAAVLEYLSSCKQKRPKYILILVLLNCHLGYDLLIKRGLFVHISDFADILLLPMIKHNDPTLLLLLQMIRPMIILFNANAEKR